VRSVAVDFNPQFQKQAVPGGIERQSTGLLLQTATTAKPTRQERALQNAIHPHDIHKVPILLHISTSILEATLHQAMLIGIQR
jgi:hypothetical protein